MNNETQKSPDRIPAPSEAESTFVRESRYIVVKIKDADKYLTPVERYILDQLSVKCSLGRLQEGKRDLRCVCVESDWPEYEPTWAAIEKRVNEPNKKAEL